MHATIRRFTRAAPVAATAERPEQFFSALIHSSPDAIACTDWGGTILAWNTGAANLFGYHAREAVGQPISILDNDSSISESTLLHKRAVDGRPAHDYSTIRRHKNGRTIPVLLSVWLLQSDSGEPLGVGYVFRESSAFSRAGEALLQANADLWASEKRFRMLAEHIADLLWEADATGRLIYLSPRFESFTGVRHSADSQSLWMQLIHPDDHEAVGKSWQAAQDQSTTFRCELRLRERTGGYRWFVARAVPVRDDGDRLVQWVGCCTDIDDLKRNQQALLRLNEELRQFAFAAAHDLQEPLRNVAVCAGMLKRQHAAALDQSATEWIEAGIESAGRGHAMVKDLLRFSTILDSAAAPHLHTQAGIALLHSLASLHDVMPPSGTICIGSLPALAVEFRHATELFTQIIDNAVKYRRPGVDCRIEVTAVPRDAQVEICIRDNGIGFSPEYATYIFGLFKRLHPLHRYEGTGIGLAICERIVAHYGGRMWAESSPGAGSAFFFLLPATQA